MLGIFQGRPDPVWLLAKAVAYHVIAERIEMLGVGSNVAEEIFPTASHAVDQDERLCIFGARVDETGLDARLNISLTQGQFAQLSPNTDVVLGHVRQPSLFERRVERFTNTWSLLGAMFDL
jgi:hypothetical protein